MSQAVVKSLQEAMEMAIRSAYEKEMLIVYNRIAEESNAKWEAEKKRMQSEIKKIANSIALSVIQKADLGGISIELKL